MTPEQVMRGMAELLVHLGAMGGPYAEQANLIREALLLIEATHAPRCTVPAHPTHHLFVDSDGVPVAGRPCVNCET